MYIFAALKNIVESNWRKVVDMENVNIVKYSTIEV